MARVWYVWISGLTTHVQPELALGIIDAIVAVTSVLGIAAATAVWLLFFPSRAAASWLSDAVPGSDAGR